MNMSLYVTLIHTQAFIHLPLPLPFSSLPQSYLEAMEENLRGFLGLLNHDQLSRREAPPSSVFKKMSSAEPNKTYVKDATSSLSAICEAMERSQVGQARYRHLVICSV